MSEDKSSIDTSIENKAGKLPEKISFDFIKNNFYREILVTGVYGGLTPQGYLQMSVFNERQAIPKQTVHKVNADGSVEEEIQDLRLTRASIIRSVESTLYMDIPTAERTVAWMQKLIDKANKLRNESTQEKNNK